MKRHSSAAVNWYMSDLTSRVVAESGNPLDRYHLGKLVLRGFADDPQFVHQIDGSSGRSETNADMLKRSIRCATAMRKLGLKVGDVMVLMAPNHLDLAVPFYAALYLGIVVAPIDRNLSVCELKEKFNVDKPKIIFCQSEKVNDVQQALDNSEQDPTVITFDQGSSTLSFDDMLHDYGEVDDNFKASDFDPEETVAMLLSTSGTTGVPKSAVFTHKNMAIMIPYSWINFTKFPTPVRSVFTISPLQWLSSIRMFLLGPIFQFTRIQSPLVLTTDHAYDIINNFRPAYIIVTPTMISTLLKPGHRERCDFTCFDMILLGGSAVHKEILSVLKDISPKTAVFNVYGITEIGSAAFKQAYGPEGSCGVPYDCYKYKLVDVETNKEICDPNVTGELWMKGPGLFKGYYNNPEATNQVKTVDGWYKTGDLLFRDEHWNYFVVDRVTSLIKYKLIDLFPTQVETVIKGHPGVLEVAVTSVPDFESGELPVACVVRHNGANVTAQEIKHLVERTLKEKEVTIGVVFISELPLTPSSKVHRRKLKDMISSMTIE